MNKRFVSLSCERLKAWLSRSLEPLDLPVLMIDAIHFRSHVSLGSTPDVEDSHLSQAVGKWAKVMEASRARAK